MTKPMMDLRELVEKSAEADLLREMIGFAAERLMELEVGVKTGAAYGEKSSDRQVQRNGYRDREALVEIGSVEQKAHFFCLLSAAQRCLLCAGLPGGNARGMDGRACACVWLLRPGAAAGPL